MDKKELRKLSKSDLIRIILSQEVRIKEIERYLKAFDNAHTPSSKKKKKSDTPKKENRFPGKPIGGNGGGIKMPEADQTKEHSLDSCPCCHNKLGDPIKQTFRKQLDLPEKLAVCTENIINHYHCKHCNKDVNAANIEDRYGVRLKSFVASLKEKGLSCQEISCTVKEMGFVSFSVATIVAIMVFFAQILAPFRELLKKEILKAPYIHSDETGLRKDGQTGHVWGFFTKGIAILTAELSRGKHIAQKMLGEYTGVNITDGYIGYVDLVIRQRCWSHLIREFKELAKTNEEAKTQYQRIKKLYSEIKIYEDIIPSKKVKNYFIFQLDDIVTCLNANKNCRKLANLITNAGDDWFTALDHTGVPFQNNLAERGLRRIVMHRKRMGCYRNEVGKNWINICLSVMQTWRLQGKSIFANLLTIANTT